MCHMHPGIRVLRQHHITGYRNILCYCRTPLHAQHGTSMALVHDTFLHQGSFFLVVDNHLVKGSQVVIAIQQHLGRSGKMAVIGEGNGTCLHHIPHLSHFLTLLALGNGTDNLHMDYRILLGTLLHSLYQSGIINYRLGIWHGGNPGIAASRCCTGARGEIFLGLLSRLPEMNVHINEARCHNLALCLKNLCPISRKVLAYSGNLAILHQHIGNLIYSIGRIDYPAALNQSFHTSLPPVSACVKIAIRTATPFCTCS